MSHGLWAAIHTIFAECGRCENDELVATSPFDVGAKHATLARIGNPLLPFNLPLCSMSRRLEVAGDRLLQRKLMRKEEVTQNPVPITLSCYPRLPSRLSHPILPVLNYNVKLLAILENKASHRRGCLLVVRKALTIACVTLADWTLLETTYPCCVQQW